MSDVPEGYKISEMGVIPEEWGVKSLDNIGSFKKGKNIPKKDLTLEGVPCVLYGEIYTKYNFTSKKLSSFIPLAIAQQSTSINKGDILFAGSGETADEIGKCFTYLGDEKACAGGDINILSLFNDDSTFLGYLLNSPQVNKQKSNLGQGSSVVHIYSSSLKTILIPTPPLPEQQAIASALSDVDALITALEQLITKKRNIKQGAMQQLLTGEKRLPGFGGAWEVKKLGRIADITKLAGFEYTKYFNSYKDGGEIIVIRGTNITNNKLDLSDIKTIPRSTSNNLQRSKLQKNDLVFAYVGTIGPVYLIEENDKYHLGPNTARITVNKDISPRFAFCYFTSSSIKNEIIDHTSIGAQPSLSMTKIRNFKIILPPLPEQQAIAQILSDMDAEIEALEQKQAKYKAIKQGMMQELLTGKTRLV